MRTTSKALAVIGAVLSLVAGNAESSFSIKKLCAAVALSLASFAAAATITIQTDGTWLAKNTAPGAGWNTNALFDTTTDGGWIGAFVNGVDCFGGMDCIWYDGTFSATQNSYFRKTFSITGPVSSGTLFGGVDDDADIWVNGVQVLSNHDGFASGFGPIDITSHLVEGLNLIAVWGWDNFPQFGQQHAFLAQLDIETTVPEPGTLALFALAMLGLSVARARRQ